jgi:rhamnosyltransferase subunit B
MMKNVKTESRNVLIISVEGTRGDINPFIGVGLKLLKTGWKVYFLTNEHYKVLIETTQIQHVSTGTSENHLAFIGDKRIWETGQNVEAIAWPLIVKPSIVTSYQFVEDYVAENKSDAVVVIGTQPNYNGALQAAEVFDLVGINVFLSPGYIHCAAKPPAPLCWNIESWLPEKAKEKKIKQIFDVQLRVHRNSKHYPELQELRAKHNMMSSIDFSLESVFNPSLKHIGYFPEWYVQSTKGWPEEFTLTNFPLFDYGVTNEANEQTFKEFVSKFGAPIIFSFGSGVSTTFDIISQVLAAQPLLDIPFVFVGGTKFSPLTERCIHLDKIAFETALPQARLMVHHGGIGTTAQSIKARIPQLIRPTAFDQFDNADKVKKLKIGDYLLEDEFTTNRIVTKISTLISSNYITSNLQSIKSKDSNSNGCDMVAKLIESWAAKSQIEGSQNSVSTNRA